MTPGWELHPALQPAPGDLVVDKTTGDTFASTPLDGEHRTLGVTRLVIAGLQSENCIRDTALGALSRDYEVTLVSDGHSTYDADGQSAQEKSGAREAVRNWFERPRHGGAIKAVPRWPPIPGSTTGPVSRHIVLSGSKRQDGSCVSAGNAQRKPADERSSPQRWQR